MLYQLPTKKDLYLKKKKLVTNVLVSVLYTENSQKKMEAILRKIIKILNVAYTFLREDVLKKTPDQNDMTECIVRGEKKK